MFHLASNCLGWAQQRGEKRATFVLIGLDNAGKSTVQKALRGEPTANAHPTVGFAKEALKTGGFNLTLYDLGGGQKIRRIWREYLAEVHGAIFVVDACDKARMEEARKELAFVVEDPLFSGKPILLFANKQDLPGSLTEYEISLELGAVEATLRGCSYNVMPCYALPPAGEGPDPRLSDGMEWLLGAARRDWTSIEASIVRQVAEQDEERERLRQEKRERVAADKAARAAAAAAAGPAAAPSATDGPQWTTNEESATAPGQIPGGLSSPSTPAAAGP